MGNRHVALDGILLSSERLISRPVVAIIVIIFREIMTGFDLNKKNEAGSIPAPFGVLRLVNFYKSV
ncbi:hypothetical protein EV207_10499 [Scopulibacillus darangshiensis]|uniref:Uncharacterized protein n=1 Tax=Scopulibacillus darangshiensis TaxID=442528 RepID=A0A4R2P7K8_9BACL|nr:hypothetical protein EV207_10499 [Scopulibacillus darangshiensis]